MDYKHKTQKYPHKEIIDKVLSGATWEQCAAEYGCTLGAMYLRKLVIVGAAARNLKPEQARKL